MTLDTQWALRWIENCRKVIHENRDYLIDLDRAIGDGDHGENMDRGFTAVVEALGTTETTDIASALKLVAKTLLSTVGGAAGPLYGTAYLRAAGKCTKPELEATDVVELIEAALGGIQARGKATTGEKTMVDAWAAALEAAKSAADSGKPAAEVLVAVAEAARSGAEATLEMKATKGRASYLGERSIGHLDPGAVSSAIIFEQAVAAVKVS
ncbi:dihydroxyacetone kinase subunit DhaL [Gleimia sp. 6138-11-ORH1]|uniref:dihydroxyacetone kinase subunit DhaL n=1 Tax=Gleimia sp. 6138-11-ORH1 TaxID=2973937 RepID=UPI00216A6D2D|nr:dihydroxyacetone kinase subunit DhaL [Gleimia sp. 6138-11-ORH1]MCS4484876.1 dihydroxyacetone kinase subunit DhaL [Gleimia sp. 6138-11-ORH1]